MSCKGRDTLAIPRLELGKRSFPRLETHGSGHQWKADERMCDRLTCSL